MKKKNQKHPDHLKYPKKSQNTLGNPYNDGFYGAIVENHPDLICEWLPDGTLTFANQAYCRYFYKSLEQLVGRSCVDYIHPDERKKFSAHIKKLKQDQSQAVIEIKIIGPNGKIRWHQWVDKMIYDQSTEQTKILSSGRDITDLKNAGD